jgi:hypothetical protein
VLHVNCTQVSVAGSFERGGSIVTEYVCIHGFRWYESPPKLDIRVPQYTYTKTCARCGEPVLDKSTGRYLKCAACRTGKR